jgi:tetratricopeptide (TPR) repeat protein
MILGTLFSGLGLLRRHRRGQPAGWGYQVLLALLAVLAGAVALAPQIFDVFTLPSWVRIVLLALAFLLALAVPVVTLRSAKLEKKRSWEQQVRGLLKEPPGTDGQLPRLSALSPYRLGVSPSRYGSDEQRSDDPYVSRVIDDRLDQALASKHFVLVVGDSKAGKSRTAYEAAARLRHANQSHDPQVLVPKGTDLLEQLLDLDPPLDLPSEPALLWLDDLTEGALAALTPALLDRLTAQMIVLGTLTAQRHDRVRSSDSDISHSAQIALRRAKVIRLDAGLTNEERVEAEQKYPEERFEAGIGEQLVAVDQLTSRYDDAREGANPHGWSVVQAVIDWMRMDVGRPIRRHELVGLCPLYLHELRPHSEHDDRGHEEALLWACQPVVSHIALLQKLPGDLDEPSYEPFDYLVAAADGQGGRHRQAILDSAWDKILAFVSPSEALRAGISAYSRRLPLCAQRVFTAVAAGHSEVAPKAAVNLGRLLERQGDREGAKVAYQQAIDSGQADDAPLAAVNLGYLLAEQGDSQGAKMAWQQAIDSGHTDWTPMAAFNLGLLLQNQGDLRGATRAYQRAINSSHPELASMALGALLQAQGTLENAKFAYQRRVIDSDHLDWAPVAVALFGKVLQKRGDLQEAEVVYQRAINSGHPEAVAMGAALLGTLLVQRRDLERAKTAYQRAIDSGDANWAPRATVYLGQLLEQQRDREGAKDAYRQAITSGHAEAAPAAAFFLGRLLEQQDDREGAKVAYRRAITSGDAEVASLAAFHLGMLLVQQGDLQETEVAYREALTSGHAEVVSWAALFLGRLLEQQGDVEGAKAAYQRAVASGHAEAASKAAILLGRLLEQQGDVEGAKAAYQRAVASMDPEEAREAKRSSRRLTLRFFSR